MRGVDSVPYAVGPEKEVDSVSVLCIVGLSGMGIFAGGGRDASSSRSSREPPSAVESELDVAG